MILKRKRTMIIGAALLIAVALEFSVASPCHRFFRDSFWNAYESYIAEPRRARIKRRLQSAWQPPCEIDGWTYVPFYGTKVPIPSCHDRIWKEPHSSGGPFSASFLAMDDGAPLTQLSILVVKKSPDEAAALLERTRKRKWIKIYRDDHILVWSIRPESGSLSVLNEEYAYRVSIYGPPYLSAEQNLLLEQRVRRIADEFIAGLED